MRKYKPTAREKEELKKEYQKKAEELRERLNKLNDVVTDMKMERLKKFGEYIKYIEENDEKN